MQFKMYKVGGCVRDVLLGIKSKDIDYAVEITGVDLSPSDAFIAMEQFLIENGYKIYLSTPACYTSRAEKLDTKEFFDFVLARKEIGYSADSREPEVVLGTLYDDLLRRDFTVNAIAEDEDGNLIDPFGGVEDLKMGILKTPVSAHITFNDDPLRLLRALRFMVTKNFVLSREITATFSDRKILEKLKKVVSVERVREELEKMFKADTVESLKILAEVQRSNPDFYSIIFREGLRLFPTTKLK